MEKKNLPSIQDLYNDKLVAKKENDLNVLLNQEPKKSWVHLHPYAKNVKYIPIERIEYLLTSIYKTWNVEVKNIQLIANSVTVTIRLFYKNPITGELNFQDGIGAMALQTEAKAGAIEFDKIKSDAVMKAAPAAESYAIKDAAEKLGKIFGKDLNRADKIGYDVLQNQFKENDNLISQNQFAYIEGLIKTSGFDPDERAELELELTSLTESRAKDFISNLEINQLDPITQNGRYSQKDISKKLSEK